jgi:hypothetical protein
MKQKVKAALHSLKMKQRRGIRSEVPRDESQVSVGGLLVLGYGRKRRSRKKRKNVYCAEDTVTFTGSK